MLVPYSAIIGSKFLCPQRFLYGCLQYELVFLNQLVSESYLLTNIACTSAWLRDKYFGPCFTADFCIRLYKHLYTIYMTHLYGSRISNSTGFLKKVEVIDGSQIALF